jgi:hypothetical protein
VSLQRIFSQRNFQNNRNFSKYSKKNFKTELQKKPKTTSEVLEEPAVLSYEELGGLSDPGLRD